MGTWVVRIQAAERMAGQMGRWTHKQEGVSVKGVCIDVQNTILWMDGWVGKWVGGTVYERMGVWDDGWAGGWMDGKMSKWAGGQMDRLTDE